MCIVVITARLGSKRLKKKNIKDFFGKPVISYPIDVCKKLKFFKNVFVSTESKVISNIAKKYGAKVPYLRPKSLADSKTGTLPVIRDFIKKLKIPMNTTICCVYPVTPMINEKLLKKSYKIYKNSSSEFLVPIIRSQYKKSQAFQLNKNKIVKKNNSNKYYTDAGQFYFGKAKSFINSKSLLFSKDSKGLVIKTNDAIDVNTIADWKKLKLMYKKKNKNAEI